MLFQLPSGPDDDDLKAAVSQGVQGDLRHNISAVANLLKTLLDCAGPVYIIIDGVDEMDQIERGILLRQLLDISNGSKETKIFFSCREEADISRILTSKTFQIRVDHRNSGSIQCFVTNETHHWFESREFLPGEVAEIERLLAPVAANAKGTGSEMYSALFGLS